METLTKRLQMIGLLNRAVMWHLQLCLKLADRLNYHMVGAAIATAIEELAKEALSEDELDAMDLAEEERVRVILQMFEKNRHIRVADDERPDHDRR